MAKSRDKELEAFLRNLPGKSAGDLARMVERDRLSGAGQFPHEAILASLRPTLRKAGVERTPTPLRLFCNVFQDLLSPEDPGLKRPGRISRSSILPVWNWLSTDVMPERATALEAAIRDAILADDDEMRDLLVLELQAEASAAIKGALAELDPKSDPNGRKRKALATRLGHERCVDDAAEMAQVLASAEPLTKLQSQLPRRIPELTEPLIQRVKRAYEWFTKHSPEQAVFVVLVVMARLERPETILRLGRALSWRMDDTLISNTDLAITGDLLVGDMERLSESLVRQVRDLAPPEQIGVTLKTFVAAFSAMTNEIGVRREGRWGKQLLAARGRIGAAMAEELEKWPKLVAAALPMAKDMRSQFYSPDIRRPPKEFDTAAMLRLAGIMEAVRTSADASAFAGEYRAAQNGITKELDLYLPKLFDRMRNAEDPELKANAMAFHKVAVELTRLLSGEEAAAVVMRRGKAAAA